MDASYVEPGGSFRSFWLTAGVLAVLVPGGLVLAVEERTRWGTLVLAAACLTLAVVVVRLTTVWASGA